MTSISKRSIWRFASEILAIKFGAFLILDALFLHSLSFDYSKFGLQGLDPYISHAYWGALFVFIGLVDFLYTR